MERTCSVEMALHVPRSSIKPAIQPVVPSFKMQAW